MSGRPVVLVALGCFWPGNDASGPNQSFIALATALQKQFEFRIVARDRAPGAAVSSAPAGWVDLGFAKARYLDIGRFGARGLASLIKQTPHDVLWLNSVYDREFTLPALIAATRRVPIILSPRGEFGVGALEVKAGKKQLFLRLARALGLWRGVTWHATSAAEARDTAAEAPKGAKIVVAANLRLMLASPPFTPPGEVLRVVFVGRIAPIKGLAFALRVLADVRAPVRFEIFGPAEDAATYAEARALAEALPRHVEVVWRGATSNEAVVEAHARSDLFVSPTGGENFGHAIFEALSCGVPALISDQTPWRGLEAKRAGWDLPLAAPEAFVAAIESFAALPAEARAQWREGARACARAYVEESGGTQASARLLREAIG
ncbi:MAG TPA: glycosyltransferase [Roseiarcus sp.]|nr:glycosyltransferase [Roseiarcus sp.]